MQFKFAMIDSDAAVHGAESSSVSSESGPAGGKHHPRFQQLHMRLLLIKQAGHSLIVFFK